MTGLRLPVYDWSTVNDQSQSMNDLVIDNLTGLDTGQDWSLFPVNEWSMVNDQ